MHPQIKLPAPGQCPICFMDLIPLEQDSHDDEGPRVLGMSESAKKLAQIVTAPVERRFADASLQMVGQIQYDETRVANISSWIPGRLDKLYADFTGVEVRAGDPMVLIYSPRLLAAQEELLQAVKTAESVGQSNLKTIRETAQATIQSARDKLRLWGLTDTQVSEIEARGTPSDQITIQAPIGGVVVAKPALEGQYVQTGTHIYTIADLSEVWLDLEAYESDLHWLRLGQTIQFSAEALPGESFDGRIAFIDPVLNLQTRTVRIRVNVTNTGRRLKPGMFARATVTAGAGNESTAHHSRFGALDNRQTRGRLCRGSGQRSSNF
jgi:Cu(I)/Ag(I) efflux system membrane fusion protein